MDGEELGAAVGSDEVGKAVGVLDAGELVGDRVGAGTGEPVGRMVGDTVGALQMRSHLPPFGQLASGSFSTQTSLSRSMHVGRPTVATRWHRSRLQHSGCSVGDVVGPGVGLVVGSLVAGEPVGSLVVGETVGVLDTGESLGVLVGILVGDTVGFGTTGAFVGFSVGVGVGFRVGATVGSLVVGNGLGSLVVGSWLGDGVGVAVGLLLVGIVVGCGVGATVLATHRRLERQAQRSFAWLSHCPRKMKTPQLGKSPSAAQAPRRSPS